MAVRTDGVTSLLRAAGEDTSSAHLDRIRCGARLLASGRLSSAQVRHMAVEIERLAETLLRQGQCTSAPARRDSRLATLSHRERLVLEALAGGHTVQEVAHRFSRSPKTINNQRTSVLRKLGLRNTAELTRYAIQHGLVSV